jgi:hypothetical protein
MKLTKVYNNGGIGMRNSIRYEKMLTIKIHASIFMRTTLSMQFESKYHGNKTSCSN